MLQYTQSPSYGLRVAWTFTWRRMGVWECNVSARPSTGGWKSQPLPASTRQYLPMIQCLDLFGWRDMAQLRSCQFLAQNTHPYTSPEKGRKALLERLRQRM